MWFKTKLDNRSNSTKQTGKTGDVKGSTIEVNASGGNDATVAVILSELLSFKTQYEKTTTDLYKRIDKIDKRQQRNYKEHIKLGKAFGTYVAANGVSKETKAKVKEILEKK